MAKENLVSVPLQFEVDHLLCMRPVIRDDICAMKNHIAHAVEQKQFERATRLVEELREKEECYKRINGAMFAITGKYY